MNECEKEGSGELGEVKTERGTFALVVETREPNNICADSYTRCIKCLQSSTRYDGLARKGRKGRRKGRRKGKRSQVG